MVVVTRWAAAIASPAGGSLLGELVDADRIRVSLPLDGSPSATGMTVDGRSGGADHIAGLASDLMLRRDGVVVFRGRVDRPDDDMPATGHQLTVPAVGYRELLARRDIASQLTFTDEEQEAIGWGVIDHLQQQTGGHLGITRRGTATGVRRDRTYSAGENAGRRLDDLGRVIDGHDWDIGADLVYRAWRHRGSGSTEPVELVRGSASIESVQRRPVPGRFANVVRVVGGPSTSPVVAETPDLATDPRGRWETTVSRPTVVLQDTVAEHAQGLLAERSRDPIVWTIRLADGAWDPTTMGLGSWVQLRANSDRFADPEPMRIHQIDIDVQFGLAGGETVVLHINHPPPRDTDDADELDARVADLEVSS